MSTVITSRSLNLIMRNGNLRRRQSQASVISSYRVLGIYTLMHGRRRFLSNNINHGLSHKIFGAVDPSKSETKMNDMTVNGTSGPSPGPSGPSPGPSSNWKTWVLGTLLSLIIPFWKYKWTPFLAFKSKVDTVVERMDTVAEIVEKVAGGVGKMAEEIAGSLPKDGKLREAVSFVKKLAKEVAKDAHKADEFLDKMVEIEDEVEKGVETFIEPVIACINQENGEATPQPPPSPPPTVEKEEEEVVVKDEDTHTPITTSTTTTTTISNHEEK